MVTSDFRPEVEIQPSRSCAMHPAIIIGTVRLLWTWLWGRYHVPQNVFLVIEIKHTKKKKNNTINYVSSWIGLGLGLGLGSGQQIIYV